MSVQHKKNFTKLDNQDHNLVTKDLAAVARTFLETRKVRLRDGKVFFPFIRILFFSKNATYFVMDPFVITIKTFWALDISYYSLSTEEHKKGITKNPEYLLMKGVLNSLICESCGDEIMCPESDFPRIVHVFLRAFHVCFNVLLLPLPHPLHKKWTFPLGISSRYVTKSTGNCGFAHIYWRNP